MSNNILLTSAVYPWKDSFVLSSSHSQDNILRSLGDMFLVWKVMWGFGNHTFSHILPPTSPLRNHVLRQLHANNIRYPQLTHVHIVDNQSSTWLIHNPEYHKHTKHIEIKFHFVWEKQASGDTVYYVSMTDQVADLFMKTLPSGKFQPLHTLLHIISL